MFLQNKLYPALPDLISNYKKVLEYKNNTKEKVSSFSKKLIGIDWEGQEIIYEPEEFEKEEELSEMQKIVKFSLPILKNAVEEGKIIYNFFEESMLFRIVGNKPNDNSEGYILVRMNKEIVAYRYKSLLFGEHRKVIDIFQVDTFKSTLINSVEKIKTKLIKKYDIKNPTTFFVDIDFETPMKETVLPIVKRKFMRDINL